LSGAVKSAALAVNVAGIPDALKAERRWTSWCYWRDDKGRQTKLPSGRSNDPSTWLTLESALSHHQGIMFCLGDGWAGADLDHCVEDGVVLYAGATNIINAFGSYREVSPSNTGIKLFGRATRIGFEANFQPRFSLTIWQAPRWFTVTGRGEGDPTVDVSRAIDFFAPAPPPEHTGPREGYADAAATSDDDLLILMVGNDTNGDDILALWRGETSAYGNDHSRADMALLRHLAFWTNYDAARVERLFRQSGLKRDHWDKSASYRRASLAKALR
jgi:primase-polymerase (primpol)-like protein